MFGSPLPEEPDRPPASTSAEATPSGLLPEPEEQEGEPDNTADGQLSQASAHAVPNTYAPSAEIQAMMGVMLQMLQGDGQ